MILCILAFSISLAYTLACLQASRLARLPRPTLNRRGGRLARLMVINKQIR
jgi:hypothetical protein